MFTINLLFQPAPEANTIAYDLRDTIYCTSIAKGDEEDFNFLWKRFQDQSNMPTERTNILSALTCSKEICDLQVMSINIFYYIKLMYRRQPIKVIKKSAKIWSKESNWSCPKSLYIKYLCSYFRLFRSIVFKDHHAQTYNDFIFIFQNFALLFWKFVSLLSWAIFY